MKIFNADRQNNIEINNLLQRIKYKTEHESLSDGSVYFPIITIRNNKTFYNENTKNLALFEELERLKIIKIEKRDIDEMNKTLEKNKNFNSNEIIVEGYIVKKTIKFLQKCKEYEKKIDEILDKATKNEMRAKVKKSNNDTNKINIIISNNKGIYRKNKDSELSYPMKTASKRKKIIHNLKDNKKNGNLLAEILYNKNLSQLSKEIKEINENFKNKLKLKEDLIINLDTGGYKLNDKYNIKFVD
ncbi:MAG: hypothetical protein KAI71_02580 [Candidatus Pacebacteria bacterium]|nr:hypothetical protein [Candidatus Paceibacterota bacterium]